ncbi:integrase core domain-containing, partial [Paramuricea clavata]
MVPAVKQVLEKFYERFGRYPKVARFDEGSEFYNNGVKALLGEHDFRYFSTRLTGKKAAIVERFDRTLKTRMWKYFTEQKFTEKKKKWIDVLPNFVHSYNHSKHRTIGMKPADVNETNKDKVWTKTYGYPLSHFPEPKFKVGDRVRDKIYRGTFDKGYTSNYTDDVYVVSEVFRVVNKKMEDIELNDFNNDYDWDTWEYDETNVDENIEMEDFLDRRDDEIRLMEFKKDSDNDTSTKRKRETNSLYRTGRSYTGLKSEYMKNLFTQDYRLNPNDGPNSKDLFSRLNLSGHWLTFDDVRVAFIDRNGNYFLSKNTSNVQDLQNFRTAYEKATEEHRKTLNSITEEETGGGQNTNVITDDVRDEINRENIDDDIEFHGRVLQFHNDGKFTEQETRELVGITVPKGVPDEKIKFLKIERQKLKTDFQTESDPDRKDIFREALEIIDQNIDDARLEMYQKPDSEEGIHRVREK